MSWESYIDSLSDNGRGNISGATIIGLNGAIWTPVSVSINSIKLARCHGRLSLYYSSHKAVVSVVVSSTTELGRTLNPTNTTDTAVLKQS